MPGASTVLPTTYLLSVPHARVNRHAPDAKPKTKRPLSGPGRGERRLSPASLVSSGRFRKLEVL